MYQPLEAICLAIIWHRTTTRRERPFRGGRARPKLVSPIGPSLLVFFTPVRAPNEAITVRSLLAYFERKR